MLTYFWLKTDIQLIKDQWCPLGDLDLCTPLRVKFYLWPPFLKRSFQAFENFLSKIPAKGKKLTVQGENVCHRFFSILFAGIFDKKFSNV